MDQKIDPNQNSTPTQIRPLFLAVGLVAIGLLGGYFLATTSSSDRKGPTEITAATTPSQRTSQTANSSYKPSPEPRYTSGSIESITWNDPIEIGNIRAVGYDYFDDSIDEDARYSGNTYYKVGTVTKGSYSGAEVILGSGGCYELCFGPTHYRFLRYNNNIIFLPRYSSYDSYIVYENVLVDSTVTISDLEFPDSINDRRTGATLYSSQRSIFWSENALFDQTGLTPVFTDSVYGTVYKADSSANPISPYDNNGLYLRAIDGSLITLNLDIDFVNENGIPAITWNDGSSNYVQYNSVDIGGCGASNLMSVQENSLLADLTVAGKNINGENIYAFTDDNHPTLKKLHEERATVYDYSTQESSLVPYSEFLGGRPMFFWVDPFGRLIKFENNKYSPQVECAKPAIYLYPETTMDVSVKIWPRGGFTYTEPDYGNGWKVTARPNGTLTEDTTGVDYPYLWWDGRGGQYRSPEKGFVIAQREVTTFIPSTLRKHGLNEQEISDFMEYWEPEMQSHPYYFVSFYGTQVMHQLAPLEISPEPDTLIRVLMDFEGLASPIEVEGYNIVTPERKGFTVVEWGGVRK